MLFDAVRIPFIQQGTLKLTTIGDSITWWLYGGYYREKLLRLNPDYSFSGSRTDICGFGHEGEGGDSTDRVITRLENIVSDTDMYILLIGTNDYGRNDPQHTFENISLIVNALKKKNSHSIVYICTILPCDDRYIHKESGRTRDEINRDVNNLLRAKFEFGNEERVVLIDTEKAFRSDDNFQDYFPDGLHPNDAGYDILVNVIHARIKNTPADN